MRITKISNELYQIKINGKLYEVKAYSLTEAIKQAFLIIGSANYGA